MASPNTLALREELKRLRQGSLKITQPLLLYGANRLTRRTQLRQVYKNGFLTYAEAKRAIREQDQEKLKGYRRFADYLKGETARIQAEAAEKGVVLTEDEALDILKREVCQANLAEQKRIAQDAREGAAEAP